MFFYTTPPIVFIFSIINTIMMYFIHHKVPKISPVKLKVLLSVMTAFTICPLNFHHRQNLQSYFVNFYQSYGFYHFYWSPSTKKTSQIFSTNFKFCLTEPRFTSSTNLLNLSCFTSSWYLISYFSAGVPFLIEYKNVKCTIVAYFFN